MPFAVRFFGCRRFSSVFRITVAGNAAIFAAWQVQEYDKMNQHFTLSWNGITENKRYWTIWTSHFSHCSLEHLMGNLTIFSVLSYALQGVMSLNWLGVHLLFLPAVASGASLASVYEFHGPEEAKSLCHDFPGLEWNRFCYYRYLELRQGLLNALTPQCCGFDELGIPAERTVPPNGYTVPELTIHFEPYQRWYYESVRSKLGMSAITMSLQGFAAAWFSHLCLAGTCNPVVVIGLGLLMYPPIADFASALDAINGKSSFRNGALQYGIGSGTDTVGHLVGFGFGIFSYLLRYRILGRLVRPPYATKPLSALL